MGGVRASVGYLAVVRLVGCMAGGLCRLGVVLAGVSGCGVAGGLHGGGVVSSVGWVGAVLGCGVTGGLHGGWIPWVSAWSGMGICPPCDPPVAPRPDTPRQSRSEPQIHDLNHI